MMGSVAEIWRHPIKSHGRENLNKVALSTGQTMPWDRVWAVAHEASKADDSAWSNCSNFTRGAKAPLLMAITARFDENTEIVTLSHPDLVDLQFSPDDAPQDLIDWSAPLVPQNRASSARIVRVKGRGLTDTEYPSISIGNLATHTAVERQIGHEISHHRWRTNIWIDGFTAWDEFNWVGRNLRIGTTDFVIRARVGRCLATTANPETGARDVDTLNALKEGWGHTDFCVYGEVIKSGNIAVGNQIEVL